MRQVSLEQLVVVVVFMFDDYFIKQLMDKFLLRDFYWDFIVSFYVLDFLYDVVGTKCDFFGMFYVFYEFFYLNSILEYIG